MKKLYIPIIIFAAMSFNLIAQEKSRKELQGDKYAFRYSFEKAIDSYSHVKHLTLEGQRSLAASYHHLDQNVQSEVVYSKLVAEPTGVLPEDHYNYATILKINGKYDESNKEMDKFYSLKPTDLRAKSYAENKDNFQSLLKDDGKYKLVHMDVNTEAEDFGTSFYKDKVVFSSSRAKAKMVKRRFNWNGKPFLNMYVSEVKESQLKDPEIFDKSLNGKYHDGPAAFSKDGNFMAFTKNTFHDKTKDKVVELQICFSTYKDGKWSKPEEFAFNNEAYSVGQPSLSADGNTMYFTSDMPGGFGGADIYKTTRTGTTWSKPENLGNKINTEGDEMFPFIQDSSKAFMFSSNGRFGLGGFDIFVCAVNGNDFERLYNAGSPLNTQYDDFAAIVNDQNKGYFSSNRTGGSGDDDIYTVDFLKGLNLGKKINGFAKDKNGKVVPNTFITLLDDKNKTLDTLTTKADGAFSFLADADKNLKLTGKKATYVDGDSSINTFGKEEIVKADVILLTKEENIVKKIQVGSDLGKILDFTPIYFDLDKSTIRPDAETALNAIVKIMNQHPDMIVQLGAYTDCRETKEYNQLLSDRRSTASVDYIKKRITKPSRISGKGYGKTKLVNNCSCDGEVVSTCSEEEHQKNRRTEFIIVKK